MDPENEHSITAIETGDGSFTLRSGRFGATYHSVQGAGEESRHVFINNGLLPYLERQATKRIRILEIGFGTGLNAFLTFLQAQEKLLGIDYHAVELYPVPVEIASRLNFTRNHSPEEHAAFLRMHECSWNSKVAISSNFELTKHLAKIEEFKGMQDFDLIYFDAFSPKEQPELWTEEIFKNMYALLGAHGRLVTYCAQGQMKRNLKAAGFSVKALKGFASKREMTVGEKN